MFNSINLLRFIFATLIFLHHYPGTSMSLCADISVRFFFILSGFVLTHGYANKISTNNFNYKDFIIKRISRIWPLHLILTIFGIYIGRNELFYTSKYIPLHLILFQSWVPDYYSYFSFSGVSWFLSVLLFCYLIFPIAVKHLMSKSKMILYNSIFIIIIVRLILSFIIPEKFTEGILYINPLLRFLDFTYGLILYILYTKGLNKNLYTLLTIISIGIYLFYHEIETLHLIWIPLGGIILLFIHYEKNKYFFNLFNFKLFSILGNISFSFFMIHKFIIKILFLRLPLDYSICKFFIIFSISIMISLIWTYKIEPLTYNFMSQYLKKIL